MQCISAASACSVYKYVFKYRYFLQGMQGEASPHVPQESIWISGNGSESINILLQTQQQHSHYRCSSNSACRIEYTFTGDWQVQAASQ